MTQAIWMGNNLVTTRQRGDIPGVCVPAVDVFVSIPLERMQNASLVRAAQFGRLVRRYINGEIEYEQVWRLPPLDPSLSVIRNPCKPYAKER